MPRSDWLHSRGGCRYAGAVGVADVDWRLDFTGAAVLSTTDGAICRDDVDSTGSVAETRRGRTGSREPGVTYATARGAGFCGAMGLTV